MTKKTVIIIASAFIGLLILLLVILWIASIVHPKYYSYEEVEEKIVTATNNFYKANPEILPINDGKSVLPYQTLVDNNYIEPLNKLLKDGDNCSCEVDVIKNSNNYTYIPRLSCSDKYSSVDFYSQFLKDHDVVTEGSGLYKDINGGYYFKGKVDNNYVSFGTLVISKKEQEQMLWRVISIDSDNTFRLIATKALDEPVVFDNRYNEQREYTDGYNDFENSLIREYLIKLETNDNVLSSSQKAKLVKSNLCIGSRTLIDKSKDGSTECSVKSKDTFMFDLIKPYEYLRASLDTNCKDLTDKSCQNFNYLSEIKKSNWTLTANPSNNYQVYSFNGNTFNSTTAENEKYLFLVIKLNSYSMFKSGDGTLNNPYIVK